MFDEDAELWEGEESVGVQTDGGDAGGDREECEVVFEEKMKKGEDL